MQLSLGFFGVIENNSFFLNQKLQLTLSDVMHGSQVSQDDPVSLETQVPMPTPTNRSQIRGRAL